MNNKGSFWDRDGSGTFDIVDVFWIALQVMAYGVGAILMLSTFGRSFHLLSSPQMNPGVFAYWPWITAAAPEAGIIIAWLAGEVGFRKGRWQLVALAAIGFVVFGIVVATMQIYDTALIEGQDITATRPWAHMIASILALITIAYSGLSTMLLSYMSRREKLNTIGPHWQEVPRQSMRLPTPVDESAVYGERLEDPMARPKEATAHRRARSVALDTLTKVRPDSDFSPPVSRNGDGL